MFNEIVVGVDGRWGGHDGIALAKDLIGQGGQLTLVDVLTSDPYLYRGVSAAYAAAESARALREARGRAGARAAGRRLEVKRI